MHINFKLSSYFSNFPSFLQLSVAASVALGSSLLLLTASRAEAQSTYYVSTTGSDANNGSESYPWASITHASTITRPGDTVLVLDGTYYLPHTGEHGEDWTISSNGTAGHPITYAAAHKWQAKLVGQGTGDGSVVVGMSGGYNILENFDITGTDANGVSLATTGTTASYNQAIGNYVHDIVTPCDSDGGSALGSGEGSDYTGISHNDFTGNLVVHVTSADGSSCSENVSSGIYEAVPYGVVANNIVINAGYAIQSWHAASNLTFFGNTEINSRIGIVVGAGDAPGGTNDYTVVQNNIAVNNSETGIHEENYTGTHNQYIDNLGYENSSDIILQNGLSCSGCLYDTNPLFISNTGDATGNYCLQSNSPALGTGIALAGILTDFYGDSRPQSGATAMGACIVHTGSSSGSSSSNASITASATTVAPGQGVRLTWTTQNAVTAEVNGVNVALNGTGVFYPTTTTAYRLTAYSSTGAMYATTVVVTVVNASITASATTVAPGQGVRLTWTTQNAATATLTGSGEVALNGTGVVYPTTTTAYTITATSSTGVTYAAKVVVTVH